MKNSTLVGLNIVLAVAVAVLFFLHFSSKKNVAVSTQAGTTVVAAPQGNFKIAYFELDSVQNHYEYYKEVRNALQAIEQQKSNELSAIKNANIAKLKEYQEKGAAMTQAEQQGANQDLMQRDKNYQRAEQLKSQELQEESFKKLQDVKKHIEDFMKEYNKDKGYSYIFSNIPDMMYFKDTAYNITADVIRGLNEMHKKKN